MQSASERYILNVTKKRIHDSQHLTERCNTDQIEDRKRVDWDEKEQLVAEGWKQCFWCEE